MIASNRTIGDPTITPEGPHFCRHLSEWSPLPMIAVEGTNHVVSYLNPAFANLIHRERNSLLGLPFAEVVPESVSNGCLAILDRVLQTGNAECHHEHEHGQTPAPTFWSYSMWPILGADDNPEGVMIQVTEATENATFRNRVIAMNEALVMSSVRQHELIETIQRGEKERRDLELQLFQAQKLESLGILAGGLAHDLNNMLTPVMGYAELAGSLLPEDSPARPMIEAISTSSRRAGDLVNQILAYAGKGRFVIQPVDLSGLIQAMSSLLEAAVGINIKLALEIAPALPSVQADVTQIRQVVLNLVTNAAEAIGEGGGTITVRTGLLPEVPKAAGQKEPFVYVEVADTGSGMTPEVIEKIFDPFFTTKFTGRGLGLAVVQGIARGHHGTIEVKSQPGHGSTFRLFLPASSKAPEATSTARGSEKWKATGTVLVIDDDKAVRDLAVRILSNAGLTVVVAGDGEEGLKMFREQQHGIDAVVLDLTMPRMGGLEAVAAMRELRPEFPAVLMSGFTVSELSLRNAGAEITRFVQKPFKIPDLLAAVRQVLKQ